jgi:anthranilate/para-aminobenzoate synthase component II
MKLKNVVLIDNFDSFTFNLVDFFRAEKCTVEIFRNDILPEEIAIEKYDLLVISPGPGVPKTSGNLMKILEKFHEQIPIFGVCLGLEAIVEFFGGSLKFVTPQHGKN